MLQLHCLTILYRYRYIMLKWTVSEDTIWLYQKPNSSAHITHMAGILGEPLSHLVAYILIKTCKMSYGWKFMWAWCSVPFSVFGAHSTTKQTLCINTESIWNVNSHILDANSILRNFYFVVFHWVLFACHFVVVGFVCWSNGSVTWNGLRQRIQLNLKRNRL